MLRSAANIRFYPRFFLMMYIMFHLYYYGNFYGFYLWGTSRLSVRGCACASGRLAHHRCAHGTAHSCGGVRRVHSCGDAIHATHG